MNRRSFLGDLALGISAAIFLPKAIAVSKWHRAPERMLYCMNPEWLAAPYEMAFVPAHFAGEWKFEHEAVLFSRDNPPSARVHERFALRKATVDGPWIRPVIAVQSGSNLSDRVVPFFVPQPT